jgi:hypothetical protein
MPEPNPNRDIDAQQVATLFAKRLPHMLDGLCADRAWLWWSGPKPSEKDRETLGEIGFRFTPEAHVCEDGRSANWYHACGTVVFRRRGRSRSTPSTTHNRVSTPAHRPRSRVANAETKHSDTFAKLAQLAEILPQ